MDGRGRQLRCARCGENIGVYETLWWRRPDGALIEGGWLAVREDPHARDPASSFYHRDCLVADPTLSGW
jgi:hypothetical protein